MEQRIASVEKSRIIAWQAKQLHDREAAALKADQEMMSLKRYVTVLQS